MVLGGRYRLHRRIGAGAMGEVWLADHVTLGTHVAVKVIDAAAHGNMQETLARFVHEARAAARLRSPNVVQVLDHGNEGRVAYIAMELLEGESLRDRLTRVRSLGPSEVGRIIVDVARAMGRAHELGILHRDLKPENVFLARHDGQEIAKVVDFGIAKIASAPPDAMLMTQDGMMVGTPAYMSPEQILGTMPVDFRSDLWQLAVITYECLCGRRPFEGRSMGELFMRVCSDTPIAPSKIAPVPAGFDEWFARATRKNPVERFSSAGELASTLLALLQPGMAMEMSARSPANFGENATHGAWEARPTGPENPRKPLVLAAILLGPLVLGGVFALAYFSTLQPSTTSPVPPDATPSAAPLAPPSATSAPTASEAVAPSAAPAVPAPASPRPAASPSSSGPALPDAGTVPHRPRTDEENAADVLGI